MQSRLVANFKPFKIDRRYTDDLDPRIKGATFWDEHQGSVGYHSFDPLSRTPLPIKYDDGLRQWVFIALVL